MPADRIPLSALIVPALDQLVATLDALSGKLVVLGLAEWRHITPSAEVARAIIDALVAGDDSETRWAWGAVDVASLPAVPTGTEAVRDDAGWWATPLGRVLASSWAPGGMGRAPRHRRDLLDPGNRSPARLPAPQDGCAHSRSGADRRPSGGTRRPAAGHPGNPRQRRARHRRTVTSSSAS